MQSSQSHEFTDVLIDLIGTEDNEDESRPDPITFSTIHPGINSALVAAQSTARPAAINRQSNFTSSSEGSSLRDRSERFNFDRIREELVQPSVPKSHSDVSTLSWSRSVGTHGEVSVSLGGPVDSQEPELIRLGSVSWNDPIIASASFFASVTYTSAVIRWCTYLAIGRRNQGHQQLVPPYGSISRLSLLIQAQKTRPPYLYSHP
ncbi:hypothetical protein B0J17DRAFT_451192 [Rhizoctonia solani]|nr:hypothetical protein B0J17DRAFT_451192 [Rhizoctonia solani]